MCGRFLMDWENNDPAIDRLRALISATEITGIAAKSEIFPTDRVPVLVAGEDKAGLSVMKWGIERADGKGRIINARAESAAQKRMFAQSFSQRRCIVPTTGFFEWSHDAEKRRYLFRLPGAVMLYLAGIYDERLDFAIITTGANRSVADIHDRMPLIIGSSEIKRWLSDREWALAALERPSPELERSEYAS